MWVLGNDYRNASRLYGALLPPQRRLHAFSGSLPASVEGLRVDLVPSRGPSVAADVTQLPFLDHSFDQIIADPPYSGSDAEKYGTPMVNRTKAMKELGRVTAPAGLGP